MNDWPIIAARWGLYIDLGMLFGIPLFALYAFGNDRSGYRYLPLAPIMRWLALTGIALSVLGCALQVSAMAGVPMAQIDVATFTMMLTGSTLGYSIILRAAILLAIVPATFLVARAPRLAAAIIAPSAAIGLGTLAWSGHGAAGEAMAGWVQLAADIVHMLAAGAWLGAIVAFLILVFGRDAALDVVRMDLARRALAGFAGIGTLLVGTLVLTGLLNSAFLIGPEHLFSLGGSLYGLLLLAKLALFSAMLALAALNRYRLTPALGTRGAGSAGTMVGKLRASLLIEGSLALLIMGLVAWLGTLAPPIAV